jgi:hypothetical protein
MVLDPSDAAADWALSLMAARPASCTWAFVLSAAHWLLIPAFREAARLDLLFERLASVRAPDGAQSREAS